MSTLARGLTLLAVFASVSTLFADSVTLTNTGGSMSLGSSFVISSSVVASPAGTFSLSCPITSTGVGTYAIIYTCSGGSLDLASTDGTIVISASFTTGKVTYSGSGGGRGNPSKYWYQFSGSFAGTITRNGVSEAITGGSSQLIGPLRSQVGTGSAPVNGGSTGAIPVYTPFYVTTGSQVLRSSDLLGTDLVAYGTTGTGLHQFYGAAGIALDSSGRIYVIDSINCRVVRIDDMTGKNWITLGTRGAGVKQFGNPYGIAVDSLGRIYVADTGNSRIVRFDDMTGKNWVSYGVNGTGVGQFEFPQSVAVDPAGHIYIPDTSNSRIVRVDDMTGTNWTTLTQSPDMNGYIYMVSAPIAVAFDPAGRIYFAQGFNANAEVVRVDDMTGANWLAVSTGGFQLTGMAADSSGNVFGSGTNLLAIEGFGFAGTTSAVVWNTSGIAMVPLPSPVPPAVMVKPNSLTYANQNTGTSSLAQTVTISNFGGSPLLFNPFAASGDFGQTNTCGSSLAGGQSCTVAVTFSPTATGTRSGALTISDNSNNLGGTQSVALAGTGTAPVVSVGPTALAFEAQPVNTTSAAQEVVLSNTGTGPLTITNTGATGPFAETNNCGSNVNPGISCAFLVTFKPGAAGPQSGSLNVTDTNGTQSVALTGSGVTAAPTVAVSPASLVFPGQQVNYSSTAQTITLSNTGTTSITNSGVAVTSEFTVSSACPATIKPNTKCTVKVTFRPTATGVQTGTLTFNLSSGALTAGLSGTGTTAATPPSLTVSPGSVTFSNYAVGDNPSQTVTVTNTNEVTAGISGLSLSGSSMYTQTHNCGASLAAGASCSIVITFQPTTYGTFNSTLTVKESSGYAHKTPVTGNAALDSGGGN